jgi:Bacterial Ig-like domain (group 2)
MISLKRLTPLGVVLCSALAACDSGPTASEQTPIAPGEPAELSRMECTVTVASGAMQCRDAVSTGPASGLVTGRQNQTVRLAASNHAYDAPSGDYSIDVNVQNLIGQALGTTDGTTLDPKGVMVFFHTEPHPSAGDMGAEVTLENELRGIVLEADQAYFQYNEVLSPNETSSSSTWEFNVPSGVTSFNFIVYVMAAVQFPDGWVDLSVTQDTLVEGASSTITATVRNALGEVLAGEPVTWGSSATSVATVDGSGGLTAVAPGTATITATAGVRTGQFEVAVCPDLAVGEAYTAVMPGASSVCFAGGTSGNAEYVYMPVNLSTSSSLSLSLTGTGIVTAAGPPSPSIAPFAGGPLLSASQASLDASDALHVSMLERDRAETSRLLGRRDAKVTRGGTRRMGPNASITPGVPTVGDLWTLNTTSGCSGTPNNRTGRVVAVGQHVIIVADTTNPAGGFTTAQYDSIKLEFDTIVHPINEGNFGAPSDLDGNQRSVAFYTRAVNELSPPASSSVVLGYFTARDMFEASGDGCTLSNEGEIFYMLVPDPTGAVNSNVRTVSYVRGATVGTMGHEMQHLINAARRIYVNDASSYEEVWLNEGISHIAEELMFYRTAPGLAPRQNVALASLTTGPNASRRVAAFNTYANQNFGRFRSWLQRPDTAGAFKTNDALAVRGAIWGFLRYAADRRNGTDSQLWYDLVNSQVAGKANLQESLAINPDEWLRDFTSAMYADDAVAGIAPEQQITSWNFRSVYGGLGGFPLGTRTLSNGVALTLSYSRGGGTTYTRFGVPTGGFAGVTALSGGVAPTSPYALIVVRTK